MHWGYRAKKAAGMEKDRLWSGGESVPATCICKGIGSDKVNKRRENTEEKTHSQKGDHKSSDAGVYRMREDKGAEEEQTEFMVKESAGRRWRLASLRRSWYGQGGEPDCRREIRDSQKRNEVGKEKTVVRGGGAQVVTGFHRSKKAEKVGG